MKNKEFYKEEIKKHVKDEDLFQWAKQSKFIDYGLYPSVEFCMWMEEEYVKPEPKYILLDKDNAEQYYGQIVECCNNENFNAIKYYNTLIYYIESVNLDPFITIDSDGYIYSYPFARIKIDNEN